MAKLTDKAKAEIKSKLEDVNIQIEKMRQAGVKVPSILINTRNQLESQLNKNKYNAIKKEWNGMDFDSTFEMEYAQLLTKCGIEYEHHRVFELMPAFELKRPDGVEEFEEKIRAIKYEPDFVICDKIIIDVKGNEATQTRTFEDKWKMLKNIHRDRYYYMLVSNHQEAGLSVSKIKQILAKHNLK